MNGGWWLIFGALSLQADPRLDRWIRSPEMPAEVQAIRPEVQRVTWDERWVTVESAGLSRQSFGALETRPFDGGTGVRHFAYRIPRQPALADRSLPVPLGLIGTFINGVPIYNLANVLSYRDQNLWHVDAVGQQKGSVPELLRTLLERREKHSPLIGFALDGYPIYGPYGWDEPQRVRSFRSSYRLRSLTNRRHLAKGQELTPAQEGPAVGGEFPAGTFVEDYEYVQGAGDLDEHNGRFARTPEFPGGTYAYFLATAEDGTMAYPYLIGPTFRGQYESGARNDWQPVNRADGLRLYSTGQPWRAGEPVPFAIASDYSVLERVHEREMHVLVISMDLADFSHIHPAPVTRDFFAGEYVFPHAGDYWIYVDHTPPGGVQTIVQFRVQVSGRAHALAALRESAERQVASNGLRARLTTKGPLEAGRDIAFRFVLTDVASGNVVADLDPYLGAWAHILFLRQEGDEVIHAHPLEEKAPAVSPWIHAHAASGPSPAEIETVTGFRQPGLYKLWLQVQRAGTVITLPFVIRIAGQASSRVPEPVPEAQVISVSSKGYSPARIVAGSNRPIRLVFQRRDAQNCASRVVFPELGIDRALPPGESVLIEIPAQPAKELSFSCGMGMYRGSLVIR